MQVADLTNKFEKVCDASEKRKCLSLLWLFKITLVSTELT